MSSLRNAVKRITHKERSQPQARAHLGILEKKKDYKERAKDYHKKQDLLQSMRQRASMRNPDEFYFGMKNAQVVDSHHRKTEQARNKQREAEIGAEAVRMMKDQDLSYVRMQKQKDMKKMERLSQSLHYSVEGSKKRKHTVFVDSNEEAEKFDAAEHFETLPELVGRSFNRPRQKDLEKCIPDEVDKTEQELLKEQKLQRKQARKLAKARASAYNELEARSQRVEALARAEAHLVTEKLLAGKGRKRKIKGAENGQPAQYKWRRQRSK
jgi:U3 small nucleolar RNA-associated protein 11